MANGKNYPLLLNAPRKVNISSEDFDKLSFIGLSSFLCSYPIVISRTKNGFELHMMESNSLRLGNFNKGKNDHPRLKGTYWRINKEAELVTGEIPNGHPLIKTLEKYFSHLIMK